MQKQDKIEFEIYLSGVAEIFDKQLSGIQMDIYFEALKNLTLEEFKRAATYVSKTCKFFPKPVEFLEQVIPNKDDLASLALIKLEKAIESYGYYQTVIFDDKIIHMVVDAMGDWMTIYNLYYDNERDWTFKRKEFISLYKTFLNNPRPYPERLIGFFETHNADRGFLDNIKNPILIGEKQKMLLG